jgi:hypothetical protein
LKLLPFSVNTSSEAPVSISVGNMFRSIGTAFDGTRWLVAGFAGGGELPPPGPGLLTPILNSGLVTWLNR